MIKEFYSILVSYHVQKYEAEDSSIIDSLHPEKRSIQSEGQEITYNIFPTVWKGVLLNHVDSNDKKIFHDSVDKAFDAIKKDIWEFHGDSLLERRKNTNQE